jgi:hypothetical protein
MQVVSHQGLLENTPINVKTYETYVGELQNHLNFPRNIQIHSKTLKQKIFILALNCFTTLGHDQVLIVVFDMYTQLRYVRNACDFSG